MSEVTMKRRRLDGYSEEDKVRIKSLMIRLLEGYVAEKQKSVSYVLDPMQVEEVLKARAPEAFQLAKDTVNAVNEYLS